MEICRHRKQQKMHSFVMQSQTARPYKRQSWFWHFGFCDIRPQKLTWSRSSCVSSWGPQLDLLLNYDDSHYVYCRSVTNMLWNFVGLSLPLKLVQVRNRFSSFDPVKLTRRKCRIMWCGVAKVYWIPHYRYWNTVVE